MYDVETDKGRREFLMRWRRKFVLDYGQRGKVLIDVNENRYLIADLGDLPSSQRNAFRRIIYW